ncbi:MAG: hypothetical protein KDD45_08870, partial [Bdellovibrionales bacterium]|nr:hypothetical protein [Bdellovibrionales bacterium]
MKSSNFILIFFSFFFIGIGAQSEVIYEHSNQDGMEDVLKDVTSIEQLLNNPYKIEQYYDAVNNYYQSKISRDYFDLMLDQLRQLVIYDPEIGNQLMMGQEKLSTYYITSDVKTNGRDLNEEIWRTTKIKIFGSENFDKDFMSNHQNQIDEISKEVHQFEQEVVALPKREQGQKKSQFYKRIKTSNHELFKAILGFVFYNDVDIRKLMAGIPDPDILIFIFENLLKEKLQINK